MCTHPSTPNTLNREFSVTEPNQSWETDFSYIRTYEGRLYVTIVMELYSRKIVGWSMKITPKSKKIT